MAFYVQLRYTRGRWRTICVERTRAEASARAAEAFPEIVDARGRHAMQVRVVSEAALEGEGGGALEQAEADLRQRKRGEAGRPGRRNPRMSDS